MGLNFTYDLEELGRYYKRYDALMAHWHAVLPRGAFLDVQYETLAGDFERPRRAGSWRIADWHGTRAA